MFTVPRFIGCAFYFMLIVGCASSAFAQSSGVVRGSVTDASGAVVVGASVRLVNATSGYAQETTTNDDGRFTFFNVPFNSYTLRIRQAGFADVEREVALRSNVPLETEVRLAVGGVAEEVTVTGDVLESVEPARSEYAVDGTSIRNLTGALPSRQIENLVLSVPGTAKDGKGTFHPRGAHYQASFVIDGVPVSDQLSTIYANNFDARNTESLSVQLGNIAPEFGNKASAVIQVTTQSGLGSGRFVFGSLSVGGGSFNSGEVGFKLGGQTKDNRFGYFLSGAANRTARFLDTPFQNAVADFGNGRIITADGRGLHNNGAGQSFFSRFDYVPNERNFFKLNLVLARSRFDVPNLASQELNGQDQVQENRNLAVYPSWQHVFNSRLVMTIAPYLRISTAASDASPGDTPITFTQDRRLPTYGVVANLAYTGRGHQIKTGIDAFVFPVGERFSFQLTDPTFNPLPANSRATIRADGTVDFAFDPNLSPAEINNLLLSFNPNLLPYDRTISVQAAANNSVITGAPRFFNTAPRQTGRQFSAYVQDTFTYRRLTVSGGVRFDRYSFLVREMAVSPRIGAAFRLTDSTTLRASYNRIAQTPSTENLLISESEDAASLVNPGTVALLGTRLLRIPLERANWFEVGVGQRLGRFGRVDAAYYRKRVRDLHDNDQFLNTTIIFPISLARGRVDGFDVKFDSARRAGFGGYFTVGTVRAVVTPPFSGGLFLSGATPEDFGGSEFIIDHDQKLNIQGALQYDNERNGFFAQLLARYDGGLVTGVSAADRAALLASPDNASGAALLNFDEQPVRTKPRTIIDASIGYDFIRRENTRVGVQFDALNLTNRIGLYNYLSVFGGTNYIPSRSFNMRLKLDF
ncbi:MAG: TonB-dependent receptor [Pyrinomonadaceae bacterium]|nr:TonB-dependent receptor [Pyrinomonadaceae bacterium]